MDVFWQPGMNLKDVEKSVIIKAFSFYGQNKTQTSISLGISIRTLDKRLEEYDLIQKRSYKKRPEDDAGEEVDGDGESDIDDDGEEDEETED